MRLNFTVTIRNEETGVSHVDQLRHIDDDEGVLELDLSWVESRLREQATDVKDRALLKMKEVGADGLTKAQRIALSQLAARYGVPFDATAFKPTFDLPAGRVAGPVGPIYVGCDPDGRISS